MRVLMAILMLGVVVAPSRWAAAGPLILCCQANGECRVTADEDCKKVGGELLPADFRLQMDRAAGDVPPGLLMALAIFAGFALGAYCYRANLDLQIEQERAKAKSLETAGDVLKALRRADEGADVLAALERLAEQLRDFGYKVQVATGAVSREANDFVRRAKETAKSA